MAIQVRQQDRVRTVQSDFKKQVQEWKDSCCAARTRRIWGDTETGFFELETLVATRPGTAAGVGGFVGP